MPEIAYIDSHCHLDFDDFALDRDDVLKRAKQHGVRDIIIPAVSAQTWQRTIAVCEANLSCHLALGLHPIFIQQHQPQHLIHLNQLIESQGCIAVGEIGLDYYLKNLDREKQLAFFSKQLIIAKQCDLPVIIHNRKAHDECIALLQEHQVNSGIIHAFNGSIQQAEKYQQMGFLLGFGGMLTYARSAKLRKLAAAIDLQHIALETDAPDMTVEQHRGQRNSPEYIPLIAEAVAEIKGVSLQEVAEVTTKNVKGMFGLG